MKRLPFLMIIAATVLLSCEAKKSNEVQTKSAGQAATDSTASAQNSTALPDQQVAEVNEGSQANAVAKPALNPPHGEPYHRCDIQVGAPIDRPSPVQPVAPPVASPQANSFNTNPIQPSVSAPAPSVSSSAAIGPKPAVNPPHGEPHHRCDLQVGAPLT